MSQEQLRGVLSGAHDALLPLLAIDCHLAKLGLAVESTRVGLWDRVERTLVAVITWPAA